ncbi:ribonuclease Oy-like [Diachasmimorpha longicaudata]|uniref:ribonuclease Oy-like n=1 Tax=Diachasmimorpha longicaudata TaxID=58733 RepID=UPI0030B90BFA
MVTSGNLHPLLLIVGGLLVVGVQTYPRQLDSHQEFEITEFATAKDFDILKLTQQWPLTICATFSNNGMAEFCDSIRGNQWTIHGLWATKLHTRKPAYCDDSAKFNATAVESIENRLNVKWPSLKKGRNASRGFWAHEWEKHGTCSAILTPINTQRKYFTKTMELSDKYNVEDLLERVNIVPGRSYSIQSIVDGLSRLLGKRCGVSYVCSRLNQRSYLSEIQICFDKSFKLVDCDNSINSSKGCFATQKIIYPNVLPDL